MPMNTVPNESSLRRAYAGTQLFRDVAVAPTFKLYGSTIITRARQLAESDDRAGTRFVDYTPVYGPWTAGGTHNVSLAFEDLAIYPRYGVRGGVAGVSDGNAVPGYLYGYTTPSSSDRLDVMSIEHSFPGIPEKAEMVIFDQFTISADADDSQGVWKWASNLWARYSGPIPGYSGTATGGSTTTVVRTGAAWTVNQWQGGYVFIRTGPAAGNAVEIASNTADTLTLASTLSAAVANGNEFEISGVFTAGITDRTRELIPAPGTIVAIDEPGGTLGATPHPKWISWSVTYQNNLSGKRFGPDVDRLSSKVGVGKAKVTGQVRLEFDDPREYQRFASGTMRKIRIEQTGSQINASPLTRKRARIDIPAAYWAQVTKDERGSNITATFAFTGFVDTVLGYPVLFSSLVPMAALP
jgi:hypothetical protein